MTVAVFFFKLIQGMLIGLGAVLPGISGGVLCVVFGVYEPIMALLSNPFRAFKKYIITLLPIVIGMGVGFLGVSKILGILLNRYPDASVCVFVGLIAGMIPSLFREARSHETSKKDYVAMTISFVVILTLLTILNLISVTIAANFGWFQMCIRDSLLTCPGICPVKSVLLRIDTNMVCQVRQILFRAGALRTLKTSGRPVPAPAYMPARAVRLN